MTIVFSLPVTIVYTLPPPFLPPSHLSLTLPPLPPSIYPFLPPSLPPSHLSLTLPPLPPSIYPFLPPSLPSIQILVALLALYLLYYITNVVNKPRLFGGEAKLKPHLLACCPTLSQYYWPTIWAFNCHCTTLLRFILQRDIDIIQYHR